MTTRRFNAGEADLDVLYKDLAEHELQPLWELKGLLTREPVVAGVPFQWRGEDLRGLGG